MPGIKVFICSLFLWLSFASPQPFTGDSSIFDSQAEVITSANHTNNNALIVDNHLETNRANWSIKTFKIPYIQPNVKLKYSIAKTYDRKLIYLEIGNTIPLKLTPRIIIFPFHSFT